MAIYKSSVSGIPSGNTSSRPSSPVIGDTYYNGQLGILEICDNVREYLDVLIYIYKYEFDNNMVVIHNGQMVQT